MTVRTNDLPPIADVEALSTKPPHYYWRGFTFDEYNGRGWASSKTLNYVYDAGEPALQELPPVSSALRIVNQQAEYAQDLGGLIYAAGELITVDHNYKVAWRLPIEQGADPYGITLEASSYRAQSLWTSPSVPQLQQAGQEYPEWIKERYLKLAEGIPERVRQLADELTADAAAPFDKAQAIESYLRTTKRAEFQSWSALARPPAPIGQASDHNHPPQLAGGFAIPARITPPPASNG